LHLNLISPLNLFGIFSGIFSIYLVYYFVGKSDIRKTLTNYLLFSMPYILVSLCGGITYEIRLWTPLIINLVIILLYYRKEF
jgi:H+/Cl- antiporter ClcA